MLTIYIDACQVCDWGLFLSSTTAMYFFPPGKKGMQQCNHIPVEHFAPWQILHGFLHAQVLLLGEHLTLTHTTAQQEHFWTRQKGASVPKPADAGCSSRKPSISVRYFASHLMGSFHLTATVNTRGAQFWWPKLYQKGLVIHLCVHYWYFTLFPPWKDCLGDLWLHSLRTTLL